MLVQVAVVALLSLIDSPYPRLAPLQNLPTLAICALIWLGLRQWPLPFRAVASVCLFLTLHTIGGRYAYSFVPYDQWLGALGLPPLSESLGLERNSWDRLVHFCFGLLLTYPILCWLQLHRGLSARWSAYIAVEFVLAGSALYEIFEWLLTVFMAGPAALEYNGQQGDVWDAQKDMALAFLGAITAVFIVRLRARRI